MEPKQLAQKHKRQPSIALGLLEKKLRAEPNDVFENEEIAEELGVSSSDVLIRRAKNKGGYRYDPDDPDGIGFVQLGQVIVWGTNKALTEYLKELGVSL